MIVDSLLIFALIVRGGLHLVLFFLSYLVSYLVLHPGELVALI